MSANTPSTRNRAGATRRYQLSSSSYRRAPILDDEERDRRRGQFVPAALPDLLLGSNVRSGESAYLKAHDRERGIYIAGSNGTGKSTLIRNLALQDISAAVGGCLIDPHGDLVDQILSAVPSNRAKNLILLDLRDNRFPFGINPFHCADPGNLEKLSRSATNAFSVIEARWGPKGTQGTSWGPLLTQCLLNLCFLLAESPGLSMADIPSVLTDEQFRSKLVSNVSNTQVKKYWDSFSNLSERDRREQSGSTINKFTEWLINPIIRSVVAQPTTSVPFRRIMQEGQFVLVRLSVGAVGDEAVDLIGSLIVTEILNAALEREDLPSKERRHFSLYFDEAQRFLSPAFDKLLTEARKYGVSLCLANQVRSQLGPELRNASLNTGTLLVFAVPGMDAEEYAKQFDSSPPAPRVSGRREKLVVAPRPVQQLMSGGHGDPAVNRIILHRLRPLQELLDVDLRPLEGKSLRRASFLHDSAEAGIKRIDQYLVEMMSRTLMPGTSAQGMAIVRVLLCLKEILHLVPEPLYWDPRIVNPLARQRLCGRREMPTEVRDMLIQFVLKRARTRQLNSFDRTAQRLSETLRSAKKKGEFPDDSGGGFRPSLALYADAVEWLVTLGSLLAIQPVLIGSKEWEPIFDRQRNFSDVQAEIANRIVNQPQFVAYCRMPSDGVFKEAQIRVVRDSSLATSLISRAAIEEVRGRSRSLYCRPRWLIEANRGAPVTSPEKASAARVVAV